MTQALVRYEEMRGAGAPPAVGFVYFFQRPSSGAVKIGFSSDPVRRASQLQTASDEPLKFLGLMRGNRAMERTVHRLLASSRRSGEWFDWSEKLADLLRGIAWVGVA